MPKKEDLCQLIEEICSQDERYKADSYEFVLQALHFTQGKLKKPLHITGKELSVGIRDFALQLYGPMAKTVLAHWGINKTEDFGNIVFNMIDKKMLAKKEEDTISDFKDVYDFNTVFNNTLQDITIKEA